MCRHQHRAGLCRQPRRTIIQVAIAIVAILNGSHLEVLHKTKESRPSHAEVGARSDLVCIYAVNVERFVFRAGTNGRREGRTTGHRV